MVNNGVRTIAPIATKFSAVSWLTPAPVPTVRFPPYWPVTVSGTSQHTPTSYNASEGHTPPHTQKDISISGVKVVTLCFLGLIVVVVPFLCYACNFKNSNRKYVACCAFPHGSINPPSDTHSPHIFWCLFLVVLRIQTMSLQLRGPEGQPDEKMFLVFQKPQRKLRSTW